MISKLNRLIFPNWSEPVVVPVGTATLVELFIGDDGFPEELAL